MRDNKSGAKYFFISFLVTMVVLAAVYIPVFIAVHPKDTVYAEEALQVAEEEQLTSQVEYEPKENDILNMVFVVTDQNDKLISVYLCRLNPVKRQIPVTCLPNELLINSKDEMITLNQEYLQNGIQGLSKVISQNFGIKIHRYAKTTQNNFIKMVDYLGSLEYLIPENLIYDNSEEHVYINIPKGMQSFDGERLNTLITFPSFSDTLFKHKLYTDVMSSYINQRLDQWYFDNIDKIFSFIINNIYSDISIMDHTRYKTPFLYTMTSNDPVSIGVFLDFEERDNGVLITDESLLMIDVYFK